MGQIQMHTQSLSIDGCPEHRIMVYQPWDEESRRLLEKSRTIDDPLVGCEAHARPLSEYLAQRRPSPTVPSA